MAQTEVQQLKDVFLEQALLSDKQQCLDVVQKLSNMEDNIQDLTIAFGCTTQKLVALSKLTMYPKKCFADIEFDDVMYKSCGKHLQRNWHWINEIMQCAEVHLRNAARYHHFFYKADYLQYAMNIMTSNIHLIFTKINLKKSNFDAQSIQKEMKDMLATFLQWQSTVDYLFDLSKNVVPVPQRKNVIIDELTVTSLAAYSNEEISFTKGDNLYLLDNSNSKSWKIRNRLGQVATVPAVTILIPAPHGAAIDAANRLRLQLFLLWTACIKRLECQIIEFMLTVFCDWNDKQIIFFQQMRSNDQTDLLNVIQLFDSTFHPEDQDDVNLSKLKSWLEKLEKKLIEVCKSGISDNEIDTLAFGIQFSTIVDILNNYKDFLAYWKTYQVLANRIIQPQFYFISENGKQPSYISSAHYVKYQETDIDVLDGGEVTKQTMYLSMHEADKQGQNAKLACVEETQECSTEMVQTHVTEEQHTFVIKSVLDPRDTVTALDFKTAMMLGIIDQTKNFYVNPLTGEKISIQEAMSLGKVMTESISRTKLRDETQSYGIITVKITRDNKPYTIRSVTRSDEEILMSPADAIKCNVLDIQQRTYRTDGGKVLSINDAIVSGLIQVDYEEDPNAVSEIVTMIYAVHGVLDQLQKEKVSFSEAVVRGLLDQDTGEYVNTLNGSRMTVQEAIMCGFIKARVITEANE